MKTIFKKILIGLLIGLGGLNGVWAQNAFDRYYGEIFELQRQLFASEANPDYESRSGGNIEQFFTFYQQDLLRIKETVNQSELSPLNKLALQVYADSVIAEAFSLLYRIEPSDKNKETYYNSRLKVLEYARQNPEDDLGENGDEQIQAWIKALYAENLFLLTDVDPGGTIAYVSELEREGYEALRENPNDIRAHLVLASYYTAILNLDPVNLNKSQRFLNRAFALIEEGENLKIAPSLPPQSLNFYRVLAWTWQSQNDLARLNSEAALTSIDQALALYPRSGFLNYVKTLIQVNRRLTQGDGGQLEDPERINFTYEYSFDYDQKFLSKHFFNFIFDDTILSPYVGIGNNFTPFALYLEAGGRLQWRTLTSELIFRHKNSFSDKLSEYYSGDLILAWADYGWKISLSSEFGQLWKYRFDDSESDFFYNGVIGLEEELAVNYLILNHPYFEIDSTLRGQYFYSWDFSEGLWNGDLTLNFDLFKLGWSELKLKTGVHLAGPSDAGKLLNRLNFFSKSPITLDILKDSLLFPQTPLTGTWLAMSSITYPFYPFYSLNTHSAVKSIFIAPSFFWGWIGDEIGEFDSRFSYSALGNIGFTFPGGGSIAFGFGWNESEDWVINILAY